MPTNTLSRVVDTFLRVVGVAALGAVPFALSGSTVSGLTSFANGSVADASAMNANFAAVQAAVNDNAGKVVPAGAVLYFVGPNCPAGWVKANGQSLTRAAYPALADAFGAGAAFTVPDLRGEFVRGFDDGRTADAGRTLLSAQGDATRLLLNGSSTGNNPAGDSPTGIITHWPGQWMAGTEATFWGSYQSRVSLANAMDSRYGRADETRPRNVALLACIRT